MTKTSIGEYYAGKNIFITGGSGFMGKVLVEKLLRSCPKLNSIYLLLRPHKGLSPKERWESIKSQEIFDRVKVEVPENLEKVIVIEGDTSEKGLGLAPEDRKTLAENVNIVFHVAATVLFFETIATSLKLNVRATFDCLNLAKEMKKMECFVHVSTAYSNAEKSFIPEERIYPAIQNWKHLIHAVETNDPYTLGCLTDKLLAGHPNSYTLTKSLAEQIVQDYSKYFPVAVMRPSVVLSCLREPIPGWTDNLNGTAVVGVLTGSGLLRVYYGEKSNRLDYTSVDTSINSFIAAAWDACQSGNQLRVYHCSLGEKIQSTGVKIQEMGLNHLREDPLENTIWVPGGMFISSLFLYNILFFFLQVIPAGLIDLCLRLCGKRPRLWKIVKKIAVAHRAYSFFTVRTYKFPSIEYKQLQSRLLPTDQEIFYLSLPEGMVEEDIFAIAAQGVRRFVLKETKSLEERKRHLQRLVLLDRAVRYIVGAFILYHLLSIII